jgi:protein-S-isoprenylcysteine O-methyltransferase Ste14
MSDSAATPGVIAPPPLIFLGFLAAGLVLEWLAPMGPEGWETARWSLSGLLIIGGASLLVAGARNFMREGTPIPTREPTRVLVTTGIHGRTRNPIYLGMFAIYLGVGLAAAFLWALILFLPLALVIRYGVVAREEVYLERKFGEAYRAYKSRVRRWL